VTAFPNTTEHWLRLHLRLLGGVCLFALIPIVMPLSWLQSCHEWMGLGVFPESPIAVYLARALSGLCVLYGGMVLVMAGDVRRYLPLIQFQAGAMLALSILSGFVWARIGLAIHWAILDVAGGASLLAPILILARRLERQANPSTDRAEAATSPSSTP